MRVWAPDPYLYSDIAYNRWLRPDIPLALARQIRRNNNLTKPGLPGMYPHMTEDDIISVQIFMRRPATPPSRYGGVPTGLATWQQTF